jgi:hypothetical protein
MNKHLLRANDELVDYFTAAIGVRAQNMAADPKGSDGEGLEGLLIREIDNAERDHKRTGVVHPTKIEKYDSIRATLAATHAGARRILEMVYTPWGAPGLLAIALTPGGEDDALAFGSYVRLALTMPRTKRTYAKQFPGKPEPSQDELLAFLTFEAGKGDVSASFFQALRKDCDEPRMDALRVYDEQRRLRRPSEIRAAEARARRKKKSDDANFHRELRGENYK